MRSDATAYLRSVDRKSCTSMSFIYVWRQSLTWCTCCGFVSPPHGFYFFSGLGGFGRNKGILGFLGGALACVPLNYRILSLAKFGSATTAATVTITPGGHLAVWLASVALGLAGAFADLAVPTPTLTLPKRIAGVRVPPFHVDDNFVVPIFSAYACTKIFAWVQWPLDLQLASFVIA